MPIQAQARILGIHAVTVVLDANQLLTAVFGGNRDADRASVDCILDELLDDRGGPLDHFAGGDLIREVVGKPSDAAHRAKITASLGA
jgi:hypothetical protein